MEPLFSSAWKQPSKLASAGISASGRTPMPQGHKMPWISPLAASVFVLAAAALIASYPLRMVVGGTPVWLSFANWLTGWAA